MNEKLIDSLFAEKIKSEEVFPEDVVSTIAEIIRRNDEFPMGSRRRVSFRRTVEAIKKEFNYDITRQQMEKIVQQLGRRSWAHE